MWEPIVTFLVGMVLQQFGGKYLANRYVQKVARLILASPDNPTTDIRDATQQAVLLLHHESVVKPAVERMLKEQDEGTLRVAAAIEAGKALTEGADITVLPRDGTEVFR
jgi:hypothetical protein